MDNERDCRGHEVAPDVRVDRETEGRLEAAAEEAQKGGLFETPFAEVARTVEQTNRQGDGTSRRNCFPIPEKGSRVRHIVSGDVYEFDSYSAATAIARVKDTRFGPSRLIPFKIEDLEPVVPTNAPNFEEVGRLIGRIVDEKHAAYGDSFGKSGDIMRILYPNGISLDQMDDALAVVRIVDKLFRIANAKDAFGESPFGDIAGYGIRGSARR